MMTIKQLVMLHVMDCLLKNDYNRTYTAKELGISKRCLTDKINLYRSLGYDIKRLVSEREVGKEQDWYVKGFPTNEERLLHLDSMINRDYL